MNLNYKKLLDCVCPFEIGSINKHSNTSNVKNQISIHTIYRLIGSIIWTDTKVKINDLIIIYRRKKSQLYLYFDLPVCTIQYSIEQLFKE